MTEAWIPPKDGNLYCPLCQIGLAGTLAPIDILKIHYKLTHPDIDKWPKDANGLPVLKDYYKRSMNASVVKMLEQVESQPEPEPTPQGQQVNTDSVEAPIVHPRDVAATKGQGIPQPKIP